MDNSENNHQTHQKKLSTSAPLIVLVGFMASGKSSVAQALAKRWQRAAVDLDVLIESTARKPISEIFADSGEEKFRQLETAQLRQVLEDAQPGVIATGGGIVTREENRVLLRTAPKTLVVYLQASNETLTRRIRQQPGLRPLIDGESVLNLQQTQLRVEELLEQRAPLYEEVADFTLKTDGLTPSEIAEKILRKTDPLPS